MFPSVKSNFVKRVFVVHFLRNYRACNERDDINTPSFEKNISNEMRRSSELVNSRVGAVRDLHKSDGEIITALLLAAR